MIPRPTLRDFEYCKSFQLVLGSFYHGLGNRLIGLWSRWMVDRAPGADGLRLVIDLCETGGRCAK